MAARLDPEAWTAVQRLAGGIASPGRVQVQDVRRGACQFGRVKKVLILSSEGAMITPPTKEPQYSLLFDVKEKHGIARLGLMVNESRNQDPKRTLFTLTRYKFVARMLAGDRHVLEVGCADAFGTRIVKQEADMTKPGAAEIGNLEGCQRSRAPRYLPPRSRLPRLAPAVRRLRRALTPIWRIFRTRGRYSPISIVFTSSPPPVTHGRCT
jgi:hypothetical protein